VVLGGRHVRDYTGSAYPEWLRNAQLKTEWPPGALIRTPVQGSLF
jgi:hypothetical protein